MKHILISILALSVPALHAADSPYAWQKAARSLAAGQTLEVPAGLYTTKGAIKIEGLRGTVEQPITLRAARRGEAVISGAAGFVLRNCEHVVLEGFLMTHDADQQSVLLDNCRHVQVTRNTFRLSERPKPRHWEHWVTVDGATSGQNRIDHNLFERKVNRGSHVFVRGDDSAFVCSQEDRVDHNHFRDVVFAQGENGHETIRTGGNDLGASDRSSFTVIEANLLERCSGEDEIMSLKSSNNIVRNNTLIDCRGAICMRLGNRNVASGNFIIATTEGPGFGGIKLYGFEHRVFNNYFCGLTGRRHDAPFALVPGTIDTPATEKIGKDYDDMTSSPPTRCWIAFNTWVDCSPLQFGFKQEKERPCIPKENEFVNNLVIHTRPRGTPLLSVELVRDMRAEGNLGFAGGAAPAENWSAWFQFADPLLRLASKEPPLWRLAEASPAIDAASTDPKEIREDSFGRARSSRLDIGAEEFGAAADLRGPLTPAQVGPGAE